MTEQNVLLARQPIYSQNKEIYAYELLFRGKESLSDIDGNRATSQVLLNAFNEAEINDITGGLPAFVNFTEELIYETPPFSPELLVIEILEDIPVTDRLLQALRKLKDRGFTLALDDFVPDPKYQELFSLVDIIKLEIPQLTIEQLKEVIPQLKKHNLRLLAEKIETHTEFSECADLGCELFQGYFLSKPEIVTGRKLPQNKLSVMQLIAKLQAPSISITQVNKTITSDPGLSFRLLRLVNSAAFRRSTEIASIHMAVMLLGISRIKAWSTLLALSNLEDKPQSLALIALQRARMCELLAEQIEPEKKDLYFTVGLFSCLDAFFDLPIDELLAQIPLDQTIQEALLRMKGKPGLVLNTVIQYERLRLKSIHWNLLEKFNCNLENIGKAYLESARWAQEHLVA